MTLGLLYITPSDFSSKLNYSDSNVFLNSPNNSSWIINWANESWHFEAIITDSLENVYVAGIVTPNPLWYAYDIDALFISKLNKNGIVEWSLTNLTEVHEDFEYYHRDLVFDLNNNIYSLWYIRKGDITESLLIKINSSGSLLWNYTFRGALNDIYLDKFGNIHLLGGELYYPENFLRLVKLNISGLMQYNLSIPIDTWDVPWVLMMDELNHTYVASIKYNNYEHFCLYEVNSSFGLELIKEFDELYLPEGIFFDDFGDLYYFGFESLRSHIVFRYNISSNHLFNFTWTLYSPSVQPFFGKNIAIDPSGNIYCAGDLRIETIVEFSEIYLFTFSENGTSTRNSIWKRFRHASCNDLYVDSNYNIYLTGDSEEGPFIVKNPVMSEFSIDVFYFYLDEETFVTLIVLSSIFGVWCLLGILLYIHYYRKKTEIQIKIKEKKTAYMKTFPYICDKCKKLSYTFREYCENCGAKDTIRDATTKDYETT